MIKLKGKDNLDKIERALIKGIRQADNRTARAIVRRAVGKAPVDTSAMRASIHVVSDEGSEYEAAKAAAIAASPAVKEHVLPAFSLDASEPEQGVHVAIVDVPVDYAELVHDGHYRVSGAGGKHVAGRPFLTEAAREEEAAHQARVHLAVRDLEKI